MISFWVDQGGLFGITDYLADRGAAISSRFAVRPYSWSEAALDIHPGAQIFSGLDQVTPTEREVVAMVIDQLAAAYPGILLLNDPRRTLFRESLLTALAERGLNDFRVHRADAAPVGFRFPVFVREASRHTGALTHLLESPGALRRALWSLRVRGFRRRDLLVVEYCDTSDAESVFRKYAAMRIGSAIVPVHLYAGRTWMLKAEGDERTLEMAREELSYVEQNPHAEWLEAVFGLSGVEYGRIDYGVRAGRPQAWEINLNPTLGRTPGQRRRAITPAVAEVRAATRELAHGRMRDAFVALDRPVAGETFRIELGRDQRRRIEAEAARIRRRRIAIGALQRLYLRSPLSGPLQAVVRRLFPRG